MIPILTDYLEALAANRVSAHRAVIDGVKMIGFKYSLTTVYSGDWDEVTLNARGIVFNEETGEIIARPFKKFFNFQEFSVDGTHSALYEKVPAEFKPNLEGPFRVMEKADGSLGIMFWTGAQWFVKTGGAFTSDQANWANKWVTKNMNVTLLDKSKTYCFEIIYPEDIHPVKYDFEGLVLLSVLDNQSGEEESLDYIKNVAEELKVRMVKLYDFTNFYEVASWAKCLPKTMEGVVVTFDNGFKCKLKGDEWCDLARMFEGITEWRLWKALDLEGFYFHAHVDETKDYMPMDEVPLLIPEELPAMRSYADGLISSIKELSGQVALIADEAQKIPVRKDQFFYVKEHAGDLSTAVMIELDVRLGKSKPIYVLKAIHKTLNPAP